MSPLRAAILRRVDEFCVSTGITPRMLGIRAVGDSHLYSDLRAGRGVTLTRIERLQEFMLAERRRQREATAED